MVYSLGPRQEQGPGQEQWGTTGLSTCPGSGVMWKHPHSFIQPICSRSRLGLGLGSAQCEYAITGAESEICKDVIDRFETTELSLVNQ